ncbi:MAG: hypothetical protein OZSIB_4064 [Candidatus Ozemobacter sibiricus]|jgi:hypothetical protein|uniref:Phospholipase C/D domain-containing protein n=1 Tax=Candidatus Ozemobacter sibiricus TaxID=2268124 RepID=A0A367ZQE2_9BACT|nr:MAG: hypothetical protein OZSIB_4064 [Candidatus Ozemobacter sibiricus]
MLNRCAIVALLALGIICSSSGQPPVWAWGSLAHKKITSDAYHIMPKGFRTLLGETDKGKPALRPLLEASIEPDTTLKDFQNHVFHIHGYKMGNGPFKVEELAKEIVADIQKKTPRAQVAQKLGWLAHYIADLTQPLHTGVATWEGIEEKAYHAACEKDANDHVYEFGVYFDGAYPVERISARMVYEALWANQYYAQLEEMYTNGKRWQDARPILAKCYSRAVNNVVDIWYSIWLRAGGRANTKIDGKPKYFPPYNPKKPSGAALPHRTIEDAEAAEATAGAAFVPAATGPAPAPAVSPAAPAADAGEGEASSASEPR